MEAVKDENFVSAILGTSSSDGTTPIAVQLDPTTHGVMIDDDTTGSDLSDNVAVRDGNRVAVLMAVSSADGVTPTPVYVDVAGSLLVDST